MRPTRDQWALGLAQLTSQRATCLRRAVGCVLLNERGHVLSTGYNGVAAGQKHCNEEVQGALRPPLAARIEYPNACPGSQAPSGTQLDACQAIHAEQNALLQCRDVHQIHTCYVTTSCCVTCVKLLLNTGCQKIVFLEEYTQPEARLMWEHGNRIWQKGKL